jgi:hypothetical protein
VNESSLYTIAEVAVTLAGFSGLVVAFQRRDMGSWSPPEFLNFLFLIANSLLVVLFSLLPIPLFLWGLPEHVIWTICSPLMAAYFLGGGAIALQSVRRHPREFEQVRPIFPWLYRIQWTSVPVAALMAMVLLLSAADVLVPRGQALYVLGLLVLLLFAGNQFVFFVVLGRRAA